MHANRKLRHRIAAFLTAMSIVVSMAVFWQLRGVGTAMDNTHTCGLQEHSHTDNCYEKVLICEDSEHEHTEECYEKRLVCGLDEHEHSSGCVSDEAADVETQAVWEKTLPEKLTDDVRENIALVAVSQLGYSESRKNYHISDDGETKNGYTRYGQWYGSPYGEWNSLFAYFCMYYAGVDRQSVPYGSGIAAWAAELEKKELLLSAKDAKLQKGDVLLIDADLDKKPDKAAVVVEMTEKDGKVLLETVQGDVDGEVAKVSIEQADEHIAGYVSLETAAAEMLFEQESASGIKVTAKAEKGAFPEKTTMTVTDIDKAEAEKTARQAIGANEKVLDAVAVDITFKDKDGRETEPAENKKVQVQITLPESKKFDEGEYSLLHVSDEGSVEKITDASVTAAGAEFETESFSIFVLASNGEYVEPGQLIMLNGNAGNNSEDNPYVIKAGEKIVVQYQGEYLTAGRFTVTGNDLSSGLHHINRIFGPAETWYDFLEGDTRRGEFTADVAGKCRIVFLRDANGGTGDGNIVEQLWVQVESPMSVKTYYNDRDKDHIKEYLGGYNLPNVDGYVPNSDTKAYLLRVGDKINVRSDASGDFILTGDAATYLRKLDTPEYPGYVTFEAIAPTQRTVIVEGQPQTQDFSVLLQHEAGGVVNDSLYVRVYSNTSTWFTHCDMEIADDGKYTLTEFTENGKTERVYKAYVTNINSDTILRDSSGSVVNTMPKDAYRKLGYPGQTQYEMTSAYYVGNFPYLGNNDLLHITRPGEEGEYEVYHNIGTDQNPNWVVWTSSELGKNDHPNFYTQSYGQYAFDVNRIASVDFNVQITLYPYEEITYTKGTDNTYTETGRTSIAGDDPEVIDNKLVHFEGQTLLDAFNKCPLDNGLDFTFMPEGALVKLQAGKELTNVGVDAKAGEFEFELRSTTNADEYLTKKYASGATVSASSLFTNPDSADNIRAYKVFNHGSGEYGGAAYSYCADMFDLDKLRSLLPQYYDNAGLASLIDRLNHDGGGDPPQGGDISADEFYKILLECAKPENAIYPDANGNFDLTAGHYFFTKDSIQATAKNDANGKVTFPYLAFSEQDKGKTLRYYMNEVADPNDPDVEHYDDTVHTVDITIGNDMSVTVKYDNGDTAPVFRNTLREYRLPDTGGGGVVPYIAFGTAMIAAAFLLLVRKKRKEAG